jgi:hypothetical protein
VTGLPRNARLVTGGGGQRSEPNSGRIALERIVVLAEVIRMLLEDDRMDGLDMVMSAQQGAGERG